MGKIIDLTNQQFGYLTVIEKTEKRAADRSVIWKCKCKCGNECEVSSSNLRSGNTKSCGCYMKERNSETHLKTIPKGTRFGRLTVLELLSERKNGRTVYKCQCDCGNIVNIIGNNLRKDNLHTTSCGCLHSEITSERRRGDIPLGTKFGNLTVIKKLDKQNNFGVYYWLCKCDCGNEKEVTINKLNSGHTTSCGCLKKSKGEEKITKILENNNIQFKKQKSFNDCRFPDTNYHAYFDFYVNNKYIIEYDGSQHFNSKESGWNTKENLIKTQEHDKIKNQYCRDHNIPIIRIPYTHYKDICLEDLLLETSQFVVNEE